MRLTVREQRDVARLHFYDTEQSSRAIARSTKLSTNTVLVLRAKIVESNKSWEELQALGDDAWREALKTQDHSLAQRKPAPDWTWVEEQMRAPDATLERVWMEWRDDGHSDGIGYTQFTTGFAQWQRSRDITMRMTHRPGEKGFVDFAGRTVEIISQDGGPSKMAKIFVGVLGYSNYTYVLAVDSEKVPDWVLCHRKWFEHIGGVPRWIVPDNLKSAVTKRTRDFITLNPTYVACLKHYDTACAPAGPYKPQEKAKAEVHVQIVQRFVIFPLRKEKFFDLEQLNAALKVRVDYLNARAFRKMNGSRLQRFNEVEKATLKPIPTRPYEVEEWTYGVKVASDHHVPVIDAFYSVPYALVGELIDIKFTASFVEVFHKGGLVAAHARTAARGEYLTNEDHRPVAHRRVLDGEPKALADWAETVGPNAVQMIRHHLEDRSDLTNGLRAARAMRSLAREHGDQRFEEVSAYALPLNITALRSIRSIFKTDVDRRPRVTHNASPLSPDQKPSHENVRGAEYFNNDEKSTEAQ
jgi:transposase